MRARSWFPDVIPGRTVTLRRHSGRNIAAFRRWYADPEVCRLTRYQDGPMVPDEVDRFFEARVTGPGSLALAIHQVPGDRLIGTCAFSQLDGDNGSALFHITIGERDCWGLGYGSEATGLMLEHAFLTLGLHRVGLAVFAFNERAIRAYTKVGFQVEGRSREAIWRGGRFWDELQMSILEGEWAAVRQRVLGLRTDGGRNGGGASRTDGGALRGDGGGGRDGRDGGGGGRDGGGRPDGSWVDGSGRASLARGESAFRRTP